MFSMRVCIDQTCQVSGPFGPGTIFKKPMWVAGSPPESVSKVKAAKMYLSSFPSSVILAESSTYSKFVGLRILARYCHVARARSPPERIRVRQHIVCIGALR